MATVKLQQGTYRGVEKDGILRFYGIPYTGPYQRFKPPTKMKPGPNSTEVQEATKPGPRCPQVPTRLEFVLGPVPSTSGPLDEVNCGVLTVARPQNDGTDLPTIVWIHGGAYVSGSSQKSWYDGGRLARDGNVVVASISYRLGAFGFLFDESRSDEPPLGIQDAIAAIEWIKENAVAFGGDPNNMTIAGHSSGAFTVQVLLDLRPDLFKRGIIQSSPAETVLSLKDARSMRKTLQNSLPKGTTVETATADELLQAQGKAIKAHPHLFLPFMPWTKDKAMPGTKCKDKKDILIGWTSADGACFAALGFITTGLPPWMAYPMGYDAGATLTKSIFAGPSKHLASTLQSQGHAVTTYEVSWGPEGFELGATHTTDLPLLFGDGDAWKDAPMLGSVPWSEWERRGKPFREAWGRFAKDGIPPPPSIDGLIIHGSS